MSDAPPRLPPIAHTGVRRPSPRLIAVGGGKGGVGKSFVASNVACALAQEGYQVALVDADLEGANLHTVLHLPAPPVSLADFAARREEDLEKLLVSTPHPNLRLIAGTHANLATPHPDPQQRARLVAGLRQLRADFVLVDLGAGSDPATVDYFLVSDDGVVILTPEPTSVENAYGFLRAAFYRRMGQAMAAKPVRDLVVQAMDQKNERGIRTPLDLLREVQKLEPVEGTRFVAAMRQFRPRIVVNQVRSASDVRLGFTVRSVCRKYFGLEAEYLGYVNDDVSVRESVVARRPIVESHPESDASVYLRRIAEKVGKSAPPRDAEGRL